MICTPPPTLFSLPCNQIVNLYESNIPHNLTSVFIRLCGNALFLCLIFPVNKRISNHLFFRNIKESQNTIILNPPLSKRCTAPAIHIIPEIGIEPITLCVWNRCSYLLSYSGIADIEGLEPTALRLTA